jgi:hypothetical protein
VNEHLANLDVGVVTEQHFPSALDRGAGSPLRWYFSVAAFDRPAAESLL